MTDWTKEPWQVENGAGFHTGNVVITARPAGMTAESPLAYLSTVLGYDEPLTDARRIVSCVNALAGFPNPEADVQALVEALANIVAFLPDPELCNDGVEKEYIQQGVNALARLRREP